MDETKCAGERLLVHTLTASNLKCDSLPICKHTVLKVKVLLQDDVEIFFSAHGVPVSYVEEAGDPYKEEMEQCISLIMQELQRRSISNHHTLAYQSRVGPVEWLQPYTDVTIRYAKSMCKLYRLAVRVAVGVGVGVE